MTIKDWYGRRFGLPGDQIRFFGELNEEQVEAVRWEFSMSLVNVEKYVYAVKRNGDLLCAREWRNWLIEKTMSQEATE